SFNSETFCIILPGTLRSDAIPVANRIRKATSRMKIPGVDSLPAGKLSASIGLAMFPEDSGDADGLLAAATEALFKAKSKGRDCVVFHEATPENPRDIQIAALS
ncbi:MAG TPA: diguanylate cyclase, partial [Geobacteraceae bacterium]|nr:diguanylate cyclase [Geobacteraceae bacterium]